MKIQSTIILVLIFGLVAIGSIPSIKTDVVHAQGTFSQVFADSFSSDPTKSQNWRVYRHTSGDTTNEASWNEPDNTFYLTRAIGRRAAATFINYDLVATHWEVEFKYKVGGNGADGFVFMFYKDEKEYGVPVARGYMGFQAEGDAPGYGIEFDSWQNTPSDGINDPSSNHIAIIKDNVGNHLAYVNDQRTEDNIWHNALISFNSGQVIVSIDNNEILKYNIPNMNYTYPGIGFSAGQWDYANYHVIDDFVLRVDDTSILSDRDGDGLPDIWETNGVDFNNDGQIDIDLPSLGATPDRKDVFVYINWLQAQILSFDPRYALLSNPLDEVITAFANASTDSGRGINLHITYATSGITETESLKEIGNITQNNNGQCTYDWTEATQLFNNDTYYPKRLRPVYHYALFGRHLPSSPCDNNNRPLGVSPTGRNGASVFVIAMGGFEEYFSLNNVPLWSRGKVRAGAFMHELGHNLGLGHGGVQLDLSGRAINTDDINYKPNHLSIMNYSFMSRGIPPSGAWQNIGFYQGIIDYSRFTDQDLPTLDENSLDETRGL